MKHITSKIITRLLPIMILGLIAFMPNAASAANAADFNPARIIDDGVFYDKNSMSVAQIQNWLNDMLDGNPNNGVNKQCDTNGTQMYNSTQTRAQWSAANGKPAPPYICLKDYIENTSTKANNFSGQVSGGISAAQIIWERSQAFNINPRVLLVLIQKESVGGVLTDDWPWESQYQTIAGFACPDSTPGVCDSTYRGFYNQMHYAARQFRLYANNPGDYNHLAGQDNNIWYRPDNLSTPQNEQIDCGYQRILIQNQATASLYNYTPYVPNAAALNNLYGTGDGCSAYGNRNFWRFWTDWFGYTYLRPNECDSRVNGVTCVWSLIKSDGSQFLTTSKSERDLTINNYGWIYEGVAFYATQAQQTGTVATYRLRQNGRHYYTAVQSDYNTLVSSGSWVDEGVAFYSYPSTASTNISHPVYRLYNSVLNQRYWTIDENKKVYLINSGYSMEATAFNSHSGLASLPQPANGRVNIYRLQSMGAYFYTTNLHELEAVIRSGYSFEGLLTTGNASNAGSPIYRLQRNSIYFYTSNLSERNIAVQNYGMSNEGIAFYLDEVSDQIYRLANTIGSRYLYTSNFDEVMLAANTGGWRFETVLIDKNTTPSPVYRFLNVFNGRHFYTININEAALITNKGWEYEGVVFYASKDTGLPVYRLRISDKHFFTANSNEKNLAISNYGYIDEGIGFYVSQTVTSKPVYRLQGGNNGFFYTASDSEKDNAVSQYGYRYEGVAFYLQP